MAVITNTYQTTGGQGQQNREVLANTIDLIDPSETPLYSTISDASDEVQGINPQWTLDSLDTPNPNNAKLEGDQYTYAAVSQPTRVGNYTQIARREAIISKTQDVVSKVGRRSEVGRARANKGLELRTDIEASMLSNNASVAGATRKSAGLRAWLASNDLLGTSGASGGYNSGTGIVDAATNGTQRAFTKALMDSALLTAYNAGGKPTMAILSPYAKTVFSTFMSDANVAQQRMTAAPRSQATIVGAADAYLSDWGLIDMVPDRQMARVGATLARNVFFITPDKLARGFLRPIQEDNDIASNADATPYVLICEFTLICRNEKAHAVIADVFGMTAST